MFATRRTTFTARFRCRYRVLALLCTSIVVGVPRLYAQTADENHPGPLSPGVNHGTVDSIAGSKNWWQVWVNPGKFEVRFHYDDSQEFVHTKETVQFGCNFRPHLAGASITFEPHGRDTICHGTTLTRASIVMVVIPKPSKLVRQTNRYTIEVTGSADYTGAAAPGATVVDVTGVYKVFVGNPAGGHVYGMVKFLPNGQIQSTEGYEGHWKIFDVSSRTYIIDFDGHHLTDIYQVGRGFADANGNVEFQSIGH